MAKNKGGEGVYKIVEVIGSSSESDPQLRKLGAVEPATSIAPAIRTS